MEGFNREIKEKITKIINKITTKGKRYKNFNS
jgi:hypothetical protein